MQFCNAGPCLAADRSLDETGGGCYVISKIRNLISSCCGKRKPTMSPLRKQGSTTQKLDSRFRGNDKMLFPQKILISRVDSIIIST